MALAHFQNQKVLLQINLMVEENEARAYHQTFYRVERILTALDIVATFFLLILDFLSFVSDDLNQKHNTLTAVWKLGYFRIYVVTLVISLLVGEVLCGKIFYGRRYA